MSERVRRLRGLDMETFMPAEMFDGPDSFYCHHHRIYGSQEVSGTLNQENTHEKDGHDMCGYPVFLSDRGLGFGW